MPRQPKEYRRIHQAEDRISPRLARAWVKANQRAATRVRLRLIKRLMRTKASKAALDAFMRELNLDDALTPCEQIDYDAFMVGGKLGAKDIDQEL